MKNKSLTQGFTLVEIMIVVAIIGILAAIAIPNFLKSRTRSQTNACIANLKQIQGAKEQLLLDGETLSDANLIGADKFIKVEPVCPADAAKTYATSYTTGDAVTDPKCNIVVATHKLP